MKKFLLAAALVMVSASAMADRVISATSSQMFVGAKIGFEDRASACDSAKKNAAVQAGYGTEIEGYSRCECDQHKTGGWRCQVDAKVVDKR